METVPSMGCCGSCFSFNSEDTDLDPVQTSDPGLSAFFPFNPADIKLELTEEQKVVLMSPPMYGPLFGSSSTDFANANINAVSSKRVPRRPTPLPLDPQEILVPKRLALVPIKGRNTKRLVPRADAKTHLPIISRTRIPPKPFTYLHHRPRESEVIIATPHGHHSSWHSSSSSSTAPASSAPPLETPSETIVKFRSSHEFFEIDTDDLSSTGKSEDDTSAYSASVSDSSQCDSLFHNRLFKGSDGSMHYLPYSGKGYHGPHKNKNSGKKKLKSSKAKQQKVCTRLAQPKKHHPAPAADFPLHPSTVQFGPSMAPLLSMISRTRSRSPSNKRDHHGMTTSGRRRSDSINNNSNLARSSRHPPGIEQMRDSVRRKSTYNTDATSNNRSKGSRIGKSKSIRQKP